MQYKIITTVITEIKISFHLAIENYVFELLNFIQV